jgi:hypothetical protein
MLYISWRAARNMLRIPVSLLTNFPFMKSLKYVATLTMAIAGLTTHVDATPITYSYIGADFTFGTGPAGFTTSDNIIASFTVNNLLAPSMTFDLTSIGATMKSISNGVYTLQDLLGFVTTDASGNIVSWGLTDEELVSGLALVRLESVDDINIGVGDSARRFNLDETANEAFNGVSGTWSSGPATVPDQGATLTLIWLALVTLVGFKYAQHKSVTASCSFPGFRLPRGQTSPGRGRRPWLQCRNVLTPEPQRAPSRQAHSGICRGDRRMRDRTAKANAALPDAYVGNSYTSTGHIKRLMIVT